ncbi:plasmid recombination protein [Vibrio hannami]|uniref:plasmid recombination protein n=1 Tax=Vibrio hannami TaxID=2717094 RepID=UPI0024107E76|nr:plasmid recombination protein [Vibrio hannami]MDG3089176.1 plasmid recombination protein [Vibrio hannami]
MSNYISFNFKYFKHSQKGTLNHNSRKHENIDNIRSDLSDRNFSLGNTDRLYQRVYDRVTERKGKSIQKNANTFIDGVLAFGRDQMDHLIDKYGKKNVQKYLDNQIKKYMEKLRDEFGFEPVSYDFHMDEGHYDKDGAWQPNYHAHIVMFNYDFKTDTAPLRKMMGKSGKRKTSLMQDLAGQAFKGGGFVRGISAEETKRKHLERDEYIAKKQAKIESELNTARLYVRELLSEANCLYESLDAQLDEHRANKLEFIESLAKAAGRGISADRKFFEIMMDLGKAAKDNQDLANSLDTVISCMPSEIYDSLYEYASDAIIRCEDNSIKISDLPDFMKNLQKFEEKVSKTIDRSRPKR